MGSQPTAGGAYASPGYGMMPGYWGGGYGMGYQQPSITSLVGNQNALQTGINQALNAPTGAAAPDITNLVRGVNRFQATENQALNGPAMSGTPWMSGAYGPPQSK